NTVGLSGSKPGTVKYTVIEPSRFGAVGTRLPPTQIPVKSGCPSAVRGVAFPSLDFDACARHTRGSTDTASSRTTPLANLVNLDRRRFITWLLSEARPNSRHLACFTSPTQTTTSCPSAKVILRRNAR